MSYKKNDKIEDPVVENIDLSIAYEVGNMLSRKSMLDFSDKRLQQ